MQANIARWLTAVLLHPMADTSEIITGPVRDWLAAKRGELNARFRQAQGSVDEGLAVAAHKLDASYTVAYIAHAPLEPRAAVAQWTDGKLTVWMGTQRPFAVRDDLAAHPHHVSLSRPRSLSGFQDREVARREPVVLDLLIHHYGDAVDHRALLVWIARSR